MDDNQRWDSSMMESTMESIIINERTIETQNIGGIELKIQNPCRIDEMQSNLLEKLGGQVGKNSIVE